MFSDFKYENFNIFKYEKQCIKKYSDEKSSITRAGNFKKSYLSKLNELKKSAL